MAATDPPELSSGKLQPSCRKQQITLSRKLAKNQGSKALRRRKTLFRKAEEFHQSCEADVFIIVRQRRSLRTHIFTAARERDWPPSLDEMMESYPLPEIITPTTMANRKAGARDEADEADEGNRGQS